jgi:hypothetical protein
MGGLVYVGTDRCCGHDGGVPCTRRPSFLVKVKACAPCAERRLPRCTTHPVCGDHAAAVRAGRVLSHVDGQPVLPEQVRSRPVRCEVTELEVDGCAHCRTPEGLVWPARFASTCSVCPQPIEAGELVWWDVAGTRVAHARHGASAGPGDLR